LKGAFSFLSIKKGVASFSYFNIVFRYVKQSKEKGVVVHYSIDLKKRNFLNRFILWFLIMAMFVE